MYTYIHIHTHVHIHTYTYTCTHIYIYIHMYTSMHIYIHMYTYIHIHTHAHMHTCTHAHTLHDIVDVNTYTWISKTRRYHPRPEIFLSNSRQIIHFKTSSNFIQNVIQRHQKCHPSSDVIQNVIQYVITKVTQNIQYYTIPHNNMAIGKILCHI